MSNAVSASSINIGELIQPDRIHGRLYHDAGLFRREMDDIFHKVWVYLGHESEVPNNGDYVRRQIGLQPVIMVRGKDGKVRVLFNRCRHRANLVCPHERGNGEVFRCQYHGWTYSNQGDLLAPTFDEAYDSSASQGGFRADSGAARTDLPRDSFLPAPARPASASTSIWAGPRSFSI